MAMGDGGYYDDKNDKANQYLRVQNMRHDAPRHVDCHKSCMAELSPPHYVLLWLRSCGLYIFGDNDLGIVVHIFYKQPFHFQIPSICGKLPSRVRFYDMLCSLFLRMACNYLNGIQTRLSNGYMNKTHKVVLLLRNIYICGSGRFLEISSWLTSCLYKSSLNWRNCQDKYY
jgi:hypothetical protein